MGTDISPTHRSQERYLEDEKWKSKNHMPKAPTQSSLMLGQAYGLGLTQNEFFPFPQTQLHLGIFHPSSQLASWDKRPK